MRQIRSRLSWLVAGWVALQFVALLAAPAVLYATVASVDVECDCPDSLPGAACPMHKSAGGHHQSSDQREATCGMRSTLAQADALFVGIVASGVMPPSRFEPIVAIRSEGLRIPLTISASRSELPDAPPPRL